MVSKQLTLTNAQGFLCVRLRYLPQLWENTPATLQLSSTATITTQKPSEYYCSLH